jgi:adenine-specific DNA-methyltransferase
MKQTAGASGGGEDKRLKKNVEYILIVAKDKDGEHGFQTFNDLYDEENLFEVIEDMEAEGKSWKYTSVLLHKGVFVEERLVLDGAGDPIRVKKYRGVMRTTVNRLVRDGKSSEEVYTSNFERIFSDTNAQTSIRTRIMEEFSELNDDEILEAEYIPRSGRDKGRTVQHYYISPTIRRVIWLKDTAVKRSGRLLKLEKTGTYWQGFPLNNLTKEGGVQFPQGKKPEALVRKIFQLTTEEGDLVLDSFAGSGTTGAVAHKMGRRWIMIELGEHIHSHIIPRMTKVVDGHDPGGVTEATGWKGGGGFRYFHLAPSLLELDRFGNHVISGQYNAAMLAEAMCKLMGFIFSPSPELYWQQGCSTETDFLYTTTQTLSRQQLESLSEEVGPNRTLMVCCSAFRAKAVDFPNLTLRKIPMAVLARCEWGKDDYSLNVANLPQPPATSDTQDPLPESAHADRPPASPADARKRRATAKRTTNAGVGSLFGEAAGEPEAPR